MQQTVQVVENTYQLAPERPFQATPVREIIKSVIEEKLGTHPYEPIWANGISQEISEEVRARVTDLDFDRYKIVVLTTVTENKSQGCIVASRCLWDAETDNYVSENFSNQHLICICTVFCTYYE
ncbi:hypothetical protein PCE1_004787 [Barthelona sp. PCE]